MKRFRNHFQVVVAVLAFTLFLQQQLFAAPSFEERNIADVGWSVVFISSVYNAETDTTVFTYALTATDWEKDLSHWVLACEADEIPVASGTNTSYGLDPTTGLYGVKWDAGQPSGSTWEYTITVNGDVGETAGHYSVKGGTYFAVGDTVCPGEGNTNDPDKLSISGIIYVDANNNGVLDPDEPRLPNVSVELKDANDAVVSTVLSGADGSYIFAELDQDYYSVDVPQSTTVSDFNEILASYFARVDPNPITVNLFVSDSVDNNFGFTLSTTSVLDDFDPNDPDGDGFTFTGTGKTIGFWKHQLSVAIKGKGRAHISASDMMNYLNTIEEMWLVDPFYFSDGAEFEDAFAILKSTSSDAGDLLRKQLLGTELNHVSGKGLGGEFYALQDILISWGEYLAAYEAVFTREELITAKDIFDLINNSGE